MAVQLFMRHLLTLIAFFMVVTVVTSCKKDRKTEGCFPDATTVRQIVNKKAVIRLNGTMYGVFILEEGSIDAKLIPCNLSMDFYQDNLQVTISGEVKATPQENFGPCCTNYFVITKITR